MDEGTGESIRYYVVLKANTQSQRWLKFWQDYTSNNTDEVRAYIVHHLGGAGLQGFIEIDALPSNEVKTDDRLRRLMAPQPSRKISKDGALESKNDAQPEARTQTAALVVGLVIRGKKAAQQVHESVNANTDSVFVGGSPDLPFAGADHWCPNEAADSVFANRTEAERLMGVDFLKKQGGTTGQNVNVVIVDQGLNATLLGSNYGGGWQVGSTLPGTTHPLPGGSLTYGVMSGRHGMMIASNILSVAPDVTFFDLPLVPWKITDIPSFLHLADAAFRRMLDDIKILKGRARSGPWILMNPWGIFDKSTEFPPGWYTNNLQNLFNVLISDAVRDGIDVVFSAGNCGQFCPDHRCSADVIGPGRSILGANSHPDVLTVGAVRADAMWLGYSSQGPGQPNLATDKPDLCASSQFCETDDAFTINTGTSAAGAMAAGVVAALRERWDPGTVPPNELINRLKNTARNSRGGKPDKRRLGSGILDAKAAFGKLTSDFPPPV